MPEPGRCTAKPQYLPVDESHPVCPVDFNGVHKLAAETYHRLLTDSGGLDAITIRLTNVYGPRMALNMPCQGFLGAFRSPCASGRRSGGIRRRAPASGSFVRGRRGGRFLAAGLIARPPSRVYNAGGPEPLELRNITRLTAAAGGRSKPLFRPFPDHLRGIDIGSYWTDSSRIRRELGWEPEVRFSEGICRTLEF
jgi:UDP-glucose 4-epimerase